MPENKTKPTDASVDKSVLEQLVTNSVAEVRRRYG